MRNDWNRREMFYLGQFNKIGLVVWRNFWYFFSSCVRTISTQCVFIVRRSLSLLVKVNRWDGSYNSSSSLPLYMYIVTICWINQKQFSFMFWVNRLTTEEGSKIIKFAIALAYFLKRHNLHSFSTSRNNPLYMPKDRIVHRCG